MASPFLLIPERMMSGILLLASRVFTAEILHPPPSFVNKHTSKQLLVRSSAASFSYRQTQTSKAIIIITMSCVTSHRVWNRHQRESDPPSESRHLQSLPQSEVERAPSHPPHPWIGLDLAAVGQVEGHGHVVVDILEGDRPGVLEVDDVGQEENQVGREGIWNCTRDKGAESMEGNRCL